MVATFKVDGYAFRLSSTHDRKQCAGETCVIHNRSDHAMRGWRPVWRNDKGIFERLCPHGIGHPDPDCVTWLAKIGRLDLALHGCEGCCSG